MTTPSNPYYRVAELVTEQLSNTPRQFKYDKPKGPPLGYVLPGPPSISHKRVPLTRGLITYVIPEDYEKTIRLRWHARWNENTQSWYAATNMKGADGGHHTEFLHRFLMGVGFRDPRQVDHKNPHDTLNNCRGEHGNLRFATQIENIRNRSKYKSNTSGFIGVSDGQYGGYRAGIRINKRQFWLGSSESKEECARIRDRAAIKYFGAFASLNFPLADYEPGGVAYLPDGDSPDMTLQPARSRIETTAQNRERVESLLRTTTKAYSEIAREVGLERTTIRRIAIECGLHRVGARTRKRWTKKEQPKLEETK